MRGAGDVKDASVETADSESEAADMTDGGGLTPFRIQGAHKSQEARARARRTSFDELAARSAAGDAL